MRPAPALSPRHAPLALVALLAGLFAGLLVVSPAAAQLEAAAGAPVAMGHHHVNTADIDASLTFWSGLLGGETVEVGPIRGVRLPNLVVLFTRREPTAGSFGSSVNHIGLQVPDVAATVARLREAGVPVVTLEHVPPATGDVFEVEDQATRVAFVESPAGVRIELFENREQERPVENHHIHFHTADPEATRSWYVERFGAAARMRGSFLSADLPGVNLTFSEGETVGLQGRALDHIGFEIDGLEEKVAELEAAGVTFDRPYTKVDALGLSFAFFTDPWGNLVELTEGLDSL